MARSRASAVPAAGRLEWGALQPASACRRFIAGSLCAPSPSARFSASMRLTSSGTGPPAPKLLRGAVTVPPVPSRCLRLSVSSSRCVSSIMLRSCGLVTEEEGSFCEGNCGEEKRVWRLRKRTPIAACHPCFCILREFISLREAMAAASSFFLIWTTPPHTFQPRFMRSVESIFRHHPAANVTLLSNSLPDGFFAPLTAAGLRVQIRRYDLRALVAGTRAEVWYDFRAFWNQSAFFANHEVCHTGLKPGLADVCYSHVSLALGRRTCCAC